MTGKSLSEIRPPAFLSRASLARELDMSESTIDEMVRRHVLPAPFELSRGCIRWSWQDIEAALATRKRGADSSPSDPFIEGARNATQTQEGRRDPS